MDVEVTVLWAALARLSAGGGLRGWFLFLGLFLEFGLGDGGVFVVVGGVAGAAGVVSVAGIVGVAGIVVIVIVIFVLGVEGVGFCFFGG